MFLWEVEVSEEKVRAIFERLDAAKEEISRCYSELNALEVIRVKKMDAESESGTQKA